MDIVIFFNWFFIHRPKNYILNDFFNWPKTLHLIKYIHFKFYTFLSYFFIYDPIKKDVFFLLAKLILIFL